MNRQIFFVAIFFISAVTMNGQDMPNVVNWKPWFIQSVKSYRLPKPASGKKEIAVVIAQQKKLDTKQIDQIKMLNAGSPGYRFQELMAKVWMNDTTYHGPLANMLLATSIHDAMIAAWDTKYTYRTRRPYETDKRIKAYLPKAESPSYPCEYSVAAGAAVTIISQFFPALKDSVNRMADRLMASRIAAGMAFPGDTKDGFALGKKIALAEIHHTKNYPPDPKREVIIPDIPGRWIGRPMAPLAGFSKTVMIDSASQFRPGPPPDWAKDMEELKNFKQTFRSTANAFFFATQPFWEDLLTKKILEYNLHLNPPEATRLYAIAAVGMYDGFIACWDAKYTYWGTRPDQYDTTFQPIVFFSPPFPGYPSGHALMSGLFGELYSYFFPLEQAYFQKRARDAAESRFQAGIHFRTDNEVGLEMGKKIAQVIIERVYPAECPVDHP